MYLISGCPRSGTHFTAALFQTIGQRVEHEARAEDGCVSWKHVATGTFIYPKRNRITEISNEGFDVVLHQVRNPLKVISSMQTLRQCSWDFMAEHAPGIDPKAPVIIKGMQSWLSWNDLIAQQASWRYRVEDTQAVFPEILSRLGLPEVPFPEIPHEARESRVKRYKPLKWKKFLKADAELAEKVRELANNYGYDVED